MIQVRYKPLKSGKFSVYLDLYNQETGNRTYEFLNIYTASDYSKLKKIKEIDKELVEMANAIKSKRELQALDNEYKLGKNRKKVPDIVSFAETCYAISNDYNDKAIINHLKKFAVTNIPSIKHVTPDWIEKFKTYLLGQIKKNSATSYLVRFRIIFDKAIKEKYINENPFKNVKLPYVKRDEIQRTTLSLEEIKKMIDTPTAFNPQIRQAFLFACFTGLRLSDVLRLEWSNISDEKIKFVQYKTRNKNTKELDLPMSEQAKKIINDVVRHESKNLVFWNLPAKTNIWTHLKMWGLEAGIKKKVHFHASRHSFATIGLTYGIDIYTMKELLGHESLSNTEIYGKIVEQKKQIEIAKFPEI